MGASIRQRAFITEGLLKNNDKFNCIEGPFIRQEVFIWSGHYRLSGHLRYMHAQTQFKPSVSPLP